MTQAVPSKSTANVTYQGAARSRVPQAVLSRSTDGSYYPRLDSRRPRISRYSPSSRSSTTRTPHRPQRPKKIVKMIWVKKGSTVGSQAVLPQTVKKSAMISPKQTWKPKGNYLDSVNRGNGSYTLKQFEGNPRGKISRLCYSLTLECSEVCQETRQENQKGKGPDWMFDLDLLTPSMNYIPVRKENYADSKEQGIFLYDAEDLDYQHSIVQEPLTYAYR
ncbi:hypothetical protein Tco_0006648 [Tanacetum coccineum]